MGLIGRFGAFIDTTVGFINDKLFDIFENKSNIIEQKMKLKKKNFY